MTSNAYDGTQDKDWYDLAPDWNNSYPYGWEPDDDGFRGQVFVSTDQSTVVLSVKGTTAPWIAGGRINDNLLFSCCCAKVGPTWSTVCVCHQGGWECDLGCLEESLVEDSLFYGVGTNLYHNISYMYPESNIWIIGHSLGGALASLLGATFGAPVIAFEVPAERMATQRLHLPSPPSLDHITHLFNTADPIPMGQCIGVTSVCAIGGYALESQCHLGKIIRYDTVGFLGWSSAIGNHLIKTVIAKLLAEDSDKMVAKKVKKGKPHALVRAVPEAVDEDVDCQHLPMIFWSISSSSFTIHFFIGFGMRALADRFLFQPNFQVVYHTVLGVDDRIMNVVVKLSVPSSLAPNTQLS
ncbi:alpha/beta-hydrolase [Mycena floridula]|nr:alpha/beta-hydrolase [Mycena floridula]